MGVTAAEIAASGDVTRLDLDELPGTRDCIAKTGNSSGFDEALLVIDGASDAAGHQLAGDVEVYGMGGAAVPPEMQAIDAALRRGIIAEAAISAWRQRLADAADSLDPLTAAEAEIVGRLDIPGRPLLTELRADRRRSANATAPLAETAPTRVVDDAITDLRASVRFGAAGLADAPDDGVSDAIELACRQGGWADRIRLLLAAEEIRAIESLATCGTELRHVGATGASTDVFDELFAEYAVDRRHAEELSALLDEAVARVPYAPQSPAKRLLRRKTNNDARKLRQSVEAFSSTVRTQSSPASNPTSWAAATKSLLELEQATASDAAESNGKSNAESSRSIDEAAALLGELFADRLSAARSLVDEVTRQHPGVDVDGRVQIIKRRAIRQLNAAGRQDGLAQPIPEVVAELAMAIAVLRGFELRTDSEFQELGRRLLTRAERIARLQAQAGNAIPLAANGFSLFVQKIQPLLAEYLFEGLGSVRPGRPGAARNAYKAARSKVWGARYDRNIADAAAGGVADALERAINASAPRLIVRYVDRSLRKTG